MKCHNIHNLHNNTEKTVRFIVTFFNLINRVKILIHILHVFVGESRKYISSTRLSPLHDQKSLKMPKGQS